jgi:exopolyphosphatase/guanosine-5'-triphosphate,3'-diphosphate pyrophosphatase
MDTRAMVSLQTNNPTPVALDKQDRIIASIDVGTNSVHMVIVRIQPTLPAFTIIAREKDTVRLGDRCFQTGRLKPEVMDRAIAALRRCQQLAASYQAEKIIAVATSAVREASNGREFLLRVQEELNLTIDLISGVEEARRIYLGVLSSMEFSEQLHMIIDIGGGSTELILGDHYEAKFLSSTKVGAVRLAAEFVTTDPVSEAEFHYLQAYIRGMLERPTEELKSCLNNTEKPRLVGTSGTIEALAAIHARQTLGFIPSPLAGYEFSRSDLEQIVYTLAQLDRHQRSQVPGLTEPRSEIILPGALILYEAMTMLGIEVITVVEAALREGIIVDWMLSQGLITDRLRYQQSIRQRSVLKIAQKYQVNLTSADRVAKFALEIFDQTFDILHYRSQRDRELLWGAAILHNCGIFISHSSHHKHSYYLIRYGELLGFTETEIEVMANLARYHRKAPPKKKHESYQSLLSKDRLAVSQMSAMLRLASALDRRQIGAVQSIKCNFYPELRELHLILTPAHPSEDCALELWSLNQKKEVFETEFALNLVTELAA